MSIVDPYAIEFKDRVEPGNLEQIKVAVTQLLNRTCSNMDLVVHMKSLDSDT